MTSLQIVAILSGGGAIVVAEAVRQQRKAALRRKRLRELDRGLANATPPPRIHLKDVETRLAEIAFAPIRKAYANGFGEVFAGFSVFRIGAAVRMDLATRHGWRLVSQFYRNLALRHLWRKLRELSRSTNVTIVVDDNTEQATRWTAAETAAFDDRGVREPWANGAATGTLITTPPVNRKLR